MKKYIRAISILLIILSMIFIFKSISLLNIVKDGDGIGLYFLGLEINDKLPFEQIPNYSMGFLVIGFALIFISMGLFVRTQNKKKVKVY